MPQPIQIVLYGNRGWIIEAIARQWARQIAQALPQSHVSVVEGAPMPGAATYLHMTYRRARPVPGARNIIYVPHVDEWYKASKLISCARQGAEFVTMSRQTQALLDAYFGRQLATCITPSSIHFHAGTSPARALRFGLFFKLYADGRKSEESIRDLLSLANSAPDLCQLVLYGKGLPALLAEFPQAQAQAQASDAAFALEEYEQKLRMCDYVLYFGKDEGAMSVVDAAALGIPVLAISQGFHKDLSLAPGSELFDTTSEILCAVKRLCEAKRDNACATDPAALFRLPATQMKGARPVSAWRHLCIPFVSNAFLKRKGNLRASSQYMHKALARQIRKFGRAALKAIHPALANSFGDKHAHSHLSKDTPDELNRTGLALAQLQMHKFAVLQFERAIAERPDFAQAHFNLARSLHELGEHAAADQSHARALALDPALSNTPTTPVGVD